MKKVTIIVLNFCTGTVSIYENIELSKQTSEIDSLEEHWLAQNTKHSMNDIAWMSKDGEIEIIYNDHE